MEKEKQLTPLDVAKLLASRPVSEYNSTKYKDMFSVCQEIFDEIILEYSYNLFTMTPKENDKAKDKFQQNIIEKFNLIKIYSYENIKFDNILETIYINIEKKIAFYIKDKIRFFCSEKTEKELNISGIIKECCKSRKTKQNNIFLLSKDDYGKNIFEPFKIKKIKLDINKNYNDDFQNINNTIISRTKDINEKGIIILHGQPGTGKTYYIRHLINKINKKILYIPSNFICNITDASMIKILTEFDNSIIIIEDADDILKKRNGTSDGSTSTILNYSDGLLNDVFNIQFICTFNIDINKIDSAFRRKGRIIAEYEFKKLDVKKANKLSLKLGFRDNFTEDATLADIYNQKDEDYNKEKSIKKVGFNQLEYVEN